MRSADWPCFPVADLGVCSLLLPSLCGSPAAADGRRQLPKGLNLAERGLGAPGPAAHTCLHLPGSGGGAEWQLGAARRCAAGGSRASVGIGSAADTNLPLICAGVVLNRWVNE